MVTVFVHWLLYRRVFNPLKYHLCGERPRSRAHLFPVRLLLLCISLSVSVGSCSDFAPLVVPFRTYLLPICTLSFYLSHRTGASNGSCRIIPYLSPHSWYYLSRLYTYSFPLLSHGGPTFDEFRINSILSFLPCRVRSVVSVLLLCLSCPLLHMSVICRNVYNFVDFF